MASHTETIAPIGGPAPEHRLPHSHGGTPTLVPHHHGGVSAADANVPAMSLLRLSIAARLASAVVFSALIWAAIHWATV